MPEELPDETIRGVVGQPDPAARPTYTRELGGRRALVGREHRSEHGGDGDKVKADGPAASARRRQRGVAAPGGDVQHPLAGAHVDGFQQLLGDDHDRRPDHVVVAARPGRLLAALDRRQIDCHGRCGHVVVASLDIGL